MRLQSVTTMSCSRLSWLQFPTPLQSPGQVLLPRGAGFHATGCAHGVRDGGRVWGKRGGYSGHPRQPKCPCAHASHAPMCLCSPCSAMRPCSASGGNPVTDSQSSFPDSYYVPRLCLLCHVQVVQAPASAPTCCLWKSMHHSPLAEVHRKLGGVSSVRTYDWRLGPAEAAAVRPLLGPSPS